LAKKRVINQTRQWRRLSFLVKIPLGLSNALPVLVTGGTRPIVILRGSWTHAEKFFLSRKLSFGQDQRRSRHIERRFLSCFVQSEKWIAGLDLIASLHLQRFQLAGKGGSDINKLAFDIALETVLWRIAATAEDENS
jgi:hypothetical protein